MVNIKKLNELPDGSGTLTNDDILLFMDDPSGSGVTKKISLNEISSAIGGANPFDQNLNTTDFPTFSGVNLSGSGIIFSDSTSIASAIRPPSAPTISYNNTGDNYILFFPPSDDGGSPILGYKFYYEAVTTLFPEAWDGLTLPDALALTNESTNGTLIRTPGHEPSFKWQNYNLFSAFLCVASYNAAGIGQKSLVVYFSGI